ncbi:hypothetical protein [Noviherbaspirillum aridicola]|uniref:Alpha/beta hydrolase n=1 Tax=Noviherbaspirillum aridicola TaxID=2849687 RepID=A0ABQ4Q6E0_9BURK|nr:hypothetical protein [Noviherbaspirillum aridicola]GIZ52552.1 hypothetical protein NCCP691_25660 [Noviherbaspirillum aridicola]
MRVLHDHFSGHARTLFVLLPGAMQQPEDLLQAGFAAAVRERGLAADVALVDFGLPFIGDVSNGVATGLLQRELLATAAQRYDRIWLCGISIGGSVAGACADAFPGVAHGLCLLAPYPGDNLTLGEIRRAGGPRQWRAAESADDAERRLWRCLQQAGERRLEVHLAYGEQDRYAPALALMASLLDARCTYTIPGRHELATWAPLWRHFLDRIPCRHP